jgi:hypothetical protein
VATEGLPLLHVPPGGDDNSVIVEYWQNVAVVGVIVGTGLTVIVSYAGHAPGVKYVIIDVPWLTPYTTPAVSTVATPVLPLLQVPPGTASERLVVAPTHTLSIPVIGATGFIFTESVTKQPDGSVKVILAVPGPTPVNTPLNESIVATEGGVLDHTPPVSGVGSTKTVESPWQRLSGPMIGSGNCSTVKGW